MKLLSIFKAISFLTTKICISTVIYLKYTNIHIHITHTWNENISIYRIIILHNRLFTLLCVYPYLNIIIVSWNACKIYNHWTMTLILRLMIFHTLICKGWYIQTHCIPYSQHCACSFRRLYSIGIIFAFCHLDSFAAVSLKKTILTHYPNYFIQSNTTLLKFRLRYVR